MITIYSERNKFGALQIDNLWIINYDQANNFSMQIRDEEEEEEEKGKKSAMNLTI